MNEKVKKSCLDFAKNPIVAGIIWKDSTTYDKYATERIPTVFETLIGGCSIAIVFGHIYHRDSWVFHCYELGFEEKMINALTAQEAAEIAIKMCKEKVQKLYESFNL